jgi:hypothetical protein
MSDNEDLGFPQPAMRGPVRGARPAAPLHEPEDDGCALLAPVPCAAAER